MKTVMKKMFSLLLVAALLVSAMPTAFADVAATATCPTHTELTGTFVSKTEPTCTTAGKAIYHCNAPAGIPAHDFEVEIPKLGHSWSAEIKSAATCSSTGLKVHTCVRGCTENETLPIDPSNHTFSNGTCTGCGICEKCKQTTCICCPQCGEVTPSHAESCPTLLCDKGCGRKAHTGFCCTNCNEYGHQVSSCDELYETCCNVAKGSAHRADCVTRCTEKRDCKNANHKAGCLYALCDTEGCQENEGHTGKHTGVPCDDKNCDYDLNHDGKHSYLCPTIGCDKAVNHTGNCSNQPEEIPGDSYLVVNVNLYTADVKTKTYELIRYENISSDTRVYSFVADHAEQIKAKLPAGYNWSGNVYHAENDKDAELMNATLGNGRTVYINAYTGQNRVYIYVHNARTFSNIRVIQMNGKKVNDTVTRKEVTALVDDYYHLNSLSMYSEDDWEKYVKNSDVQSVDSLTLHEDVTEIHVRISGSSRGTSYTADSTNPKTGDMIFTPVIIMGASVSALAVLFYLNKKRAF